MTLIQLIDVVGVFTDLSSQSKEDKTKNKAEEPDDLANRGVVQRRKHLGGMLNYY